MAKHKTLPKNFKELARSGDLTALREVLARCVPDATGGSAKQSALMFTELPQEILRELLDAGADPNFTDIYGNTPLSAHAFFAPENIPMLLEAGAQIDFHTEQGETALHRAAGFFRVEGVRALLKAGADPECRSGWHHDTALQCMLASVQPVYIRFAAPIAELLLAHGAVITDDMRAQVLKIGHEFEFFRSGFAAELLDETDAALKRLYAIFDVEPVPPRTVHDGRSPITAEGDTWTAQYDSLWSQLVPASGHAATVQGEAIRLIGRLSHEVLDNGAMNWDEDFAAMAAALPRYLSQGKQPAPGKVLAAAAEITEETEEAQFAALAEAVVGWIAANPDPIPLGEVPYFR